MTDQQTRHAIGRALGAEPSEGGSTCAVCGESPFPVARRARKFFGPGFVDYDLIAGGHPDVCAGCVEMMGGKPSKENPPLRMGHFVIAGGQLERADGERLVEVLRAPPADIEAVGWACSRQKHASLRCGPCTPAELQIGCDHGTIRWRPAADRELLDAVSALRRAARQADIASGEYPPHTIKALGPDTWREAEAVVERYRPSLHLDLAVALVRRPLIAPKEAIVAVPEEYRRAADLLHALTQESGWRHADPIRFWSELLPRRLAAAASSSTLVEWFAYLMQGLDVAASRAGVVDALRLIDGLEEAAADKLMSVLRRDHRLIITYTRLVAEENRA